jgi:hypothetical protein
LARSGPRVRCRPSAAPCLPGEWACWINRQDRLAKDDAAGCTRGQPGGRSRAAHAARSRAACDRERGADRALVSRIDELVERRAFAAVGIEVPSSTRGRSGDRAALESLRAESRLCRCFVVASTRSRLPWRDQDSPPARFLERLAAGNALRLPGASKALYVQELFVGPCHNRRGNVPGEFGSAVFPLWVAARERTRHAVSASRGAPRTTLSRFTASSTLPHRRLSPPAGPMRTTDKRRKAPERRRAHISACVRRLFLPSVQPPPERPPPRSLSQAPFLYFYFGKTTRSITWITPFD